MPRSNNADIWSQRFAKQTHHNDASWWKTFRDPVLNNLIEVAYRNNLTQQIAGVRILQARAQLNATIGNLFPQQQNLSGALNYTKVSTPDRLASFTQTNDSDGRVVLLPGN
jgi:outer membrane protein TolC